jgi:hypothetical protein
MHAQSGSYLGQTDAVHAFLPQHALFHRVARAGHAFPVWRLSSREQSLVRQCLMGEMNRTAQVASLFASKRTAAPDTADDRVARDHPSHVLSSSSAVFLDIFPRAMASTESTVVLGAWDKGGGGEWRGPWQITAIFFSPERAVRADLGRNLLCMFRTTKV